MRSLEKCLTALRGADLLVHTGDFYDDALKLQGLTHLSVIGVCGNCDYVHGGPWEKIFNAGPYKVLLTHGHLYGVKRGLNALFHRAMDLDVHLVVFGHTHRQLVERREGVLFVNPGSPKRPLGDDQPGCALIELSGEINARLLKV